MKVSDTSKWTVIPTVPHAGGWATKSQKEAIKLCIKLVADGDIQRATGEC